MHTAHGRVADGRHNLAIDVREVLPVIDAPTLAHTGDPVVPVAAVARPRRPHSRRAFLSSCPATCTSGPESAAALPILAEFLTGERREAEPDRVLATVLFTDIGIDLALGDAEWRGCGWIGMMTSPHA